MLLVQFLKMPRDGWQGCQRGRHGLQQRRGNFCFLTVMPHPCKQLHSGVDLGSPRISLLLPRALRWKSISRAVLGPARHGALLSGFAGRRPAQAAGELLGTSRLPVAPPETLGACWAGGLSPKLPSFQQPPPASQGCQSLGAAVSHGIPSQKWHRAESGSPAHRTIPLPAMSRRLALLPQGGTHRHPGPHCHHQQKWGHAAGTGGCRDEHNPLDVPKGGHVPGKVLRCWFGTSSAARWCLPRLLVFWGVCMGWGSSQADPSS